MTKTEQNRVVAWRLKLIREASELPRGVAQTCRHFGLSRKTFYKWSARYKSYGEAGLCDRPRAPLHCPRSTPRAVISKILYLRERYRFGPARTTSYLHRFHNIDVARSTVHRILIRYGMNRLPVNQRRQPTGRPWHRYEKAQPGHRLQIDVKFLERIAGSRKRLYQFTAIDDCTRIRVLKIYDVCNQKSAISFVDEVVRRLPFRVLVIQTDNGGEFQSNFHWHLEEQDIRHVYIRPRTPRLNGKVERSHRVDEQEFYQLLDKNGIGDDIHLFNDKLREWEDYYNYHRPHGALDGQTPYERLLARKTSASVLPKS
jgi:transposase InsO family protein